MKRRLRRVLCRLLHHPARRFVQQQYEGPHPWAPAPQTWLAWDAFGWACRWCDWCDMRFGKYWPDEMELCSMTQTTVRSQAELERMVAAATREHHGRIRTWALR